MTVTIIERGKLPDQTLRGRCTNCKTLIECQPVDAKTIPADPRDPRDRGGYEVHCPLTGCSHTVLLVKRKDHSSYLEGAS